MMTPKFSAASKLALLLAAAAITVVGLGLAPASAQSAPTPQQKRQQQYDKDGRPYYGARGPNQVYQQGPHTRVYVTPRS
jgi:hypothetical protein